MKIIINKYNSMNGFHPDRIKDFNWKDFWENEAKYFNSKARVYYVFDGKKEVETTIQ